MSRRNLAYWAATLSAMILGLLSIVASLRVPTSESRLLEAFGDALLIAGFLSLTVDRYIKLRTVKEISSDVAQFFIGYQLPSEVQARIKELLGCTLIRENLDLHWGITQSDEPGKVKVAVRFTFDVTNISNETVSYRQSVFVEKHDNPCIEKLECVSSKRAARYRMNKQQIEKAAIHEPGITRVYGKRIRIKPNRSTGQPSYRVSAHYSMILPDEYSDIFAFGGTTLNVRISADVPDTMVFDAPTSEPDNRLTNPWSYRKLFVAGQHMRVRWFKAPDSGTERAHGRNAGKKSGANVASAPPLGSMGSDS